MMKHRMKSSHALRSSHRIHDTLAYIIPLQAALVEGMESLSQAKVGSALQVFFNLDELQLVGC